MKKNNIMKKYIYYNHSKKLQYSVCILYLLFLVVVSRCVYFQCNENSINKKRTELLNSVIELNKQIKAVSDHTNKKLNVLYETYKQDLKTVERNGKIYTLIGENQSKGYKEMVKIAYQVKEIEFVKYENY